MRGRHVINGKVMRTPSLSAYDNMKPRPEGHAEPAPIAPFGETLHLNKDAPRTQPRDYALLVALGVNGEVPLAQARVNAGLDPWPATTAWLAEIAANDNHEIAAKAA